MEIDKKTIIILMFLMFLPIVIATPSFFIEQNKNFDLKISCFNSDNSFCLVTTNCSITVSTPNSTVIVNNQDMTFNTAYYNYTIKNNNLRNLGEYQVITQCTGATDGFQTFSFEVTFDGLEPQPTAKAINNIPIIFGMIIAIIFFSILGYFTKFEKTASMLFGLKFLSYAMAVVETVLLSFILYALTTDLVLTGILRVNFYIILIVGMGFGFAAIYLTVFRFVDFNTRKEEEEKNKKW